MTHPIQKLIDVMAALREPKTGCPWDLEQDFKSIAPYTIEEAYEVADAIDRGDMDDLREELGDLLLQPIYHAQMAAEQGAFTIEDVINDITEKMISRHPHVFADAQAEAAEDVNKIWEQRKELEKNSAQSSVMDEVTLGLPALLRAQKLQKKAAKLGFEWTDIADVLDKLEEEIGELKDAIKSQDAENTEEELGDILFVAANIARVLDLNAEETLRKANQKFVRRFTMMEELLSYDREKAKKLSLHKWEELWIKVKTIKR